MGDVRVFISSPGDAQAERARIERAIDRLNGLIGGSVRLKAIRWESGYYTAASTFQTQIPEAAECDIVLAVLRHRLGTPLPEDFKRMSDGAPYPSGTAYEILSAVHTSQHKGTPDVYVFRYAHPPQVGNIDDTAALTQTREDWERLKGFFQSWFETDTGQFKAAFHRYDSVDVLEGQVEDLLQTWVEDHLNTGQLVEWPIHLKGSPFRGLAAFGARHAAVFFGRRRETLRAAEALKDAADRGTPALLLVGPSGSGKSSLARAGLIPHLTAPGAVSDVDLWRVASLCPGEHPDGPVAALAARLFTAERDMEPDDEGWPRALPELAHGDFATPDALAALLAGTNTTAATGPILAALDRVAEETRRTEAFDRPVTVRLLLLVDQFEQLFADAVDQADRTAFTTLLRALVETRRVWVIGTLRADYYEAFIADPNLLPLKRDGAHVDLRPPGMDAMAEIIRAPARAAALVYEVDAKGTGLDERILAEADRPDMLPLVQFTLNRLFEVRSEASGEIRLTHAAYDAMGGLDGAINQEADRAIANLGEADRKTLPRLLRLMVVPATNAGSASEASRRMAVRPIPWRTATGDPAQRRLVEALIEARILYLSGSGPKAHVQLAHQRVLESWALARKIVADNVDFFRIRQDVEDARVRWQTSNRPRDRLIPPGVALAEAESLAARFQDELTEDTRGFIRASGRRARRRQRLTTMAAAVFAGVAVLAAWSYMQAETARNEAAGNYQIALNVVDGLALDIIEGLQTNWSVPVEEKLYVADRIEGNLGDLVAEVEDDQVLRLRYADVLASTAYMLALVGHHRAAEDSAQNAARQLATIDPDTIDTRGWDKARPAALTQARVNVALALGRWQAFDQAAVERHLRSAEDSLARLSASETEVTASDVAELRAWMDDLRITLMIARRDTLAYQEEHMAAVERRRADLERARDNGDTRAARLIAFHLAKLAVGDAAFAAGTGARDFEDRHKRASEISAEVASVFVEPSDPALVYIEASMDLTRAANLAERGGQDATALATRAIQRLFGLVQQDFLNLEWRHILTHALGRRAQWASAHSNATLSLGDALAARQIALSSLRDGGLTRDVFATANWADYVTGAHRAVGSQDARAAFARITTRVDGLAADGVDDPALARFKFLAKQGLARHLLKRAEAGPARADDASRRRLLLEAKEAAMAALDTLPDRPPADGTASLPTEIDRHAALTDLVRIAEQMTETRLLDQALDDALRQNAVLLSLTGGGAVWHQDRGALRARLADTRAEQDRWQEAGEAYARAARDFAKAMAADAPTAARLQNLLAYAQRALKAQAKTGDWAAAKALFAEVTEILDGLDTLPGDPRTRFDSWIALTEALETAAPSPSAFQDTIVDLQSQADRVTTRLQRPPTETDPAHGNRAHAIDFRPLDLPTAAGSSAQAGVPDGSIGWEAPPLMSGPWTTLVGADFETAVGHLKAMQHHVPGENRRQYIRIRTLRLPFYQDARVLEAEYPGPDGRILSLGALRAKGVTRLLDGTELYIVAANSSGLEIDTHSLAAGYLKFRQAYTAPHGSGPPDRIVESLADLHLQPGVDPSTRERIGALIRPLAVWRDPDAPGGWRATAAVLRGNTLLHAAFRLDQAGTVTMTEHRVVASGLLVRRRWFSTDGSLVTDRPHGLDVRALDLPDVQAEPRILLRLAEGNDAATSLGAVTLIDMAMAHAKLATEHGEMTQAAYAGELARAARTLRDQDRPQVAERYERELRALSASTSGEQAE
ncbi:AAA family ATPase [uncultured Rhodospira sp.]|uniref:nSTAND1 domain-containing NTPase n=1 Tax=uncultured Rhodospira sp. TaxID=1936189 RepID=UPI00261A3985|nr:AAA family ATPase [uncultured Rhodospira sp.]